MYMTKILCTAIALLGALGSLHAQQPRLVVQIVVGSMRADDIDRYAANFGDGGFLRLQRGGAVFTGSRYDSEAYGAMVDRLLELQENGASGFWTCGAATSSTPSPMRNGICI